MFCEEIGLSRAYRQEILHFFRCSFPDSFFKIDTDSLFLEGDNEAFSCFESLCRKTLLDTETRPLQFAYHDFDGDLVLLASEGAFLLALRECRRDSLKVFVQEAGEPISIDSNVSRSMMEQSIANLQHEVSSLKIAFEKHAQSSSILNNTQSTLRPPHGLWEFHSDVPISKPNRISFETSMAFLWGRECVEEAGRITFSGPDAAAVLDLSAMNAGLYRAVIEVADCQAVGGVCFAGIIEGDYNKCRSTLQQKSYDALHELSLTVSPRSRKASTTTSKLIVPALEIHGQSRQGSFMSQKFVVTGSKIPFSLLSVTLEESWPGQKVKGLHEEWDGLVNGFQNSQDTGPKYVVEEPELNVENFMDSFLDSTMLPGRSLVEDVHGQGPDRRHVYTKLDLLR